MAVTSKIAAPNTCQALNLNQQLSLDNAKTPSRLKTVVKCSMKNKKCSSAPVLAARETTIRTDYPDGSYVKKVVYQAPSLSPSPLKSLLKHAQDLEFARAARR